MARTPLLSALQRLAAMHRAAARQGLPVEAWRDETAERRHRRDRQGVDEGRRQLLAGAGLAAGALLLPRWVRAADAPVIAIVGGGIAGLNCALQLRDAGVTSTVYEGQGRLGGRMFSNNQGYWDEGQVSEWGGEFVDSGHQNIRHLAKRFGLALDDVKAAEGADQTSTFKFKGQYYPEATAVADFQGVVDALMQDLDSAPFPTLFNAFTAAGQVLDNMSVYQWIETRVPGGHTSPFGQVLDVAYATEFGADTSDQSALNLVYLLGFQPESGEFEFFGESDERFHVRGGNQQVPLAIAQALGVGSAVLTQHALERIARTPGGRYELNFAKPDGTELVTADIVVLAIPFAVMKHVDFADAGFDALKLRAIRELGRGHNGKLQLQFSSRYWQTPGPWGVSNGDSYTDAGYQQTWEVTRAQPGTSGILNFYTAAEVTDSMTTRMGFATIRGNDAVRADATRFLGLGADVFPGLMPFWNGKATQSVPHRSRWFENSYSFYRAGQYTTFCGHERTRQGSVHFCGEHTSVNFQGYMEGGAATGRRAAAEILRTLGKAVQTDPGAGHGLTPRGAL